jgi:hypothetical protein
VYLIKSGEFEVTKKIKIREPKRLNVSQLIGFSVDEEEESDFQRLKKKALYEDEGKRDGKPASMHKIALIGPG